MTRSVVDETHDPKLVSWVASANGHDEFPIQNLPFGVFSVAANSPRIGVAIGDRILDLSQAMAAGLVTEPCPGVLEQTTLNALFALEPEARTGLRRQISRVLSDRVHRNSVEPMLLAAESCALHPPAAIGDYTDFYAGLYHAQNVGSLFRPDNPLLPNFKYLPIAYHGRASSIRLTGVPVVRPKGQRMPFGASEPVYGPSQRLDYELELGIWIGRGNAQGTTIPIREARRHIAGYCLLNDWSARDLQIWEYQPLGPFLGKNFHSTISPWVITADAMAPFFIPQLERPAGDPRPLDYLFDSDDQLAGALSVEVAATLTTERMRAEGLRPHVLSRGPASTMYWTCAQIVTHHASNGCNLRPGDLLGSGTLSAATRDGLGSLLEITRSGKEPIVLPNGQTRTFLEDGDEIALCATAHAEGYVPIGFGECRAAIVPAR